MTSNRTLITTLKINWILPPVLRWHEIKWWYLIHCYVSAGKVHSLCSLRQYFTPEFIFQVYTSTTHLVTECCIHILSGAFAMCLDSIGKIQSSNDNRSGLVSRFQSISHRRNEASNYLFYKYFHFNLPDSISSLIYSFHEIKRSSSCHLGRLIQLLKLLVAAIWSILIVTSLDFGILFRCEIFSVHDDH